jgi:hypothetical protein
MSLLPFQTAFPDDLENTLQQSELAVEIIC